MTLELFLYYFVTIVIVILGIIYFKIIYPEKKIYDALRAQGIPGEPFRPLIGQLPELRKHRQQDSIMDYFLTLCQKHGSVFLFNFGPLHRIIITDPDLLRDVLGRTNAQYYVKPPLFNTVLSPLLGDHNLLLSEGKEHERARKMINPAFYHNNLTSMVSIISHQTAKAIDQLLSKKQPVDLQVEFNALTLSIIVASAFGSDFERNPETKDILCRVLVDVLEATAYRSLIMVNQIPFLTKLPFWKRDIVENGARITGEVADKIIADRRSGKSSSLSDGPDLLDLLLSAVDDEGEPFTDQEIREQSLTFVAAGSETTGNLMTWMLYVLMTHEHVLQACREEVDRILPKGTEPTNEHLSQLIICEAVINETLRLYPPAPLFARACIKEHTIGTKKQIVIPKGTNIIVVDYALHRREDLWPRPLEFDYTRWLRDPTTGFKSKLAHPFAYLPFASGQRNCIGQNFALLEARIMLAMFVQRCNFEIIPGQKIVPDVKITMRPKYGLLAKVSQR